MKFLKNLQQATFLNERVAEGVASDLHDFIQVVQGAGWHSVIYTPLFKQKREGK